MVSATCRVAVAQKYLSAEGPEETRKRGGGRKPHRENGQSATEPSALAAHRWHGDGYLQCESRTTTIRIDGAIHINVS